MAPDSQFPWVMVARTRICHSRGSSSLALEIFSSIFNKYNTEGTMPVSLGGEWQVALPWGQHHRFARWNLRCADAGSRGWPQYLGQLWILHRHQDWPQDMRKHLWDFLKTPRTGDGGGITTGCPIWGCTLRRKGGIVYTSDLDTLLSFFFFPTIHLLINMCA